MTSAMTAIGIHAHPDRKLGARTPKALPMLPFERILTGEAPAKPFAADYLAPLKGKLKMLGNDKAGDCEAVRYANDRFQITSALTDKPTYPSQTDVWKIYQTQNPQFKPGTGEFGYGSKYDAGMDTQTLCEYLHAEGGTDGVKMLAFAVINPRRLDLIELAINVFGAVYLDILVLSGNQDEFADGKPWTNDGSDIDGGHAVLGGAVGSDSNKRLGMATWADEAWLTDNFLNSSVQGNFLLQQVIVPIWPEHAGTRQFDVAIDRDALVAEYATVTGGKVLTLPDPGPTPDPEPDATVTRTFTAEQDAALTYFSDRKHATSYIKAAADAYNDSEVVTDS